MDKLRLDKRQIIKSSEKFTEIFTHGKRYNSKNILVLVKADEKTKFGLAVSKKIKGAVKRNRAKRRLKEVLRLNKAVFPEHKNYILLAKPGIEKQNFQLLTEELVELIKQVR